MRKSIILAAFAVGAAMATPAFAENQEGTWQIKILGSAVLPDGSVKSEKVDPLNLVPGSVGDTVASDNVVPTLAIERFLTPNISLETICCVTGHHVTVSAGALKGTAAIDNVQIIPATLTAKYHVPLGVIKPYLGVGPTLFIMLNDRPSDAIKSLGVTRTHMTSELGVVVQAGVDVPLNARYGISLDAKKYWVGTDATFYTHGGTALKTRHDLDPWVLSAGVSYRF